MEAYYPRCQVCRGTGPLAGGAPHAWCFFWLLAPEWPWVHGFWGLSTGPSRELNPVLMPSQDRRMTVYFHANEVIIESKRKLKLDGRMRVAFWNPSHFTPRQIEMSKNAASNCSHFSGWIWNHRFLIWEEQFFDTFEHPEFKNWWDKIGHHPFCSKMAVDNFSLLKSVAFESETVDYTFGTIAILHRRSDDRRVCGVNNWQRAVFCHALTWSGFAKTKVSFGSETSLWPVFVHGRCHSRVTIRTALAAEKGQLSGMRWQATPIA